MPAKACGFESHLWYKKLHSGEAFLFLTMYFVYAIQSLNWNYIYVGITNDVERRLKEHNNGYNKTTKPYLPFTLIYMEKLNSRSLAREREKFLKSGLGTEFLKKYSK